MVIKMRLDKYLSECTGKTRSQVKALVKKGLVTVDGVPAKSPDMKIDETSSAVTMDGKTLSEAISETDRDGAWPETGGLCKCHQ